MASPRLDLAIALVLFHAGKATDATDYAKQAWSGSERTMVFAATLWVRCLLDARKYGQAIDTVRSIIEKAQADGTGDERKQHMAECVGKTLGFLDQCETIPAPVKKSARELDVKIRQSKDKDLLEHYTTGYDRVAMELENAKGTPDKRKRERMRKLSDAGDVAQQKRDDQEEYKREAVNQLEKRLSKADEALGQAEIQCRQMMPMLKQQSAYVEKLKMARKAAIGRPEAIVDGRRFSQAGLQQEYCREALHLQTLQQNLENAKQTMNTAAAERRVVFKQYQTLTGQMSENNKAIESQSEKAQRAQEGLKKNMEKSRARRTNVGAQIAAVFPIDFEKESQEILLDRSSKPR
jgi:predicted  nucleic acid-binding Zn-ribbon protein